MNSVNQNGTLSDELDGALGSGTGAVAETFSNVAEGVTGAFTSAVTAVTDTAKIFSRAPGAERDTTNVDNKINPFEQGIEGGLGEVARDGDTMTDTKNTAQQTAERVLFDPVPGAERKTKNGDNKINPFEQGIEGGLGEVARDGDTMTNTKNTAEKVANSVLQDGGTKKKRRRRRKRRKHTMRGGKKAKKVRTPRKKGKKGTKRARRQH
jgi:hypothetical protein